MAYVTSASLEDARFLAPRLRTADVEEVRASTGLSQRAALMASMLSSVKAWTARDDSHVPFAIFGVADCGTFGCPWLLATDALRAHRAPFLRHSREIVEQMHEVSPVLMNYVDQRHTASIRWLRWCGFTIGDLDLFHGYEKRPFFQFFKVRHV